MSPISSIVPRRRPSSCRRASASMNSPGGLSDPRWMAVAPNGDVFLALPRLGQVLLLRDKDGDGKAELKTVFAAGFQRPHGLAVHGGYLYVAEDRRRSGACRSGGDRAAGRARDGDRARCLRRRRCITGRAMSSSPPTASASSSPSAPSTISARILCPMPRSRASPPTAATRRPSPRGCAIPWASPSIPGTNDLYTVVNERDGLGDGLVPDYLTRLQEGGFYGWPYAYIGHHPQPDFPSRPEMVAKTMTPDLLFQSHSAPLGLVFYDGRACSRRNTRAMPSSPCTAPGTRASPPATRSCACPSRTAGPRAITRISLTGFWLERRKARPRSGAAPSASPWRRTAACSSPTTPADVIWRVQLSEAVSFRGHLEQEGNRAILSPCSTRLH